MAVVAGVFNPGSVYFFVLQAQDANGAATAQIRVPVNDAPSGGSLAAPVSAIALESSVSLVTDVNAWNDSDRPLRFQFAYRLPGEQNATDSKPVLLTEFTTVAKVTVRLPGGDEERGSVVVVMVRARDALGAVSQGWAEQAVVVTWPMITNGEEIAYGTQKCNRLPFVQWHGARRPLSRHIANLDAMVRERGDPLRAPFI